MEVAFRVDANGLLTVSAKEQRSGTETEIEVVPSHGLTQSEIDHILEESFDHAISDFNARQLIEFGQTAARMFRGIEQCWTVAEATLSTEERQELRTQMDVVSSSMQGGDAAALKRQIDALGELTRPLADTAMGRAVLEELQIAAG